VLVVVGGHSRNIGKTSVVAGIIGGLRDLHWTAMKITQYGHHVCSRAGAHCECADPKRPIAISEESGDKPDSDSGRFLAAGAVHSYWVRTPAGRLAQALPLIRPILAKHENVIVESNSILQFLKPAACVMVLDGGVADFKRTSLRFLDRADFLAVTSDAPLSWPCVSPAILSGKPMFSAHAPAYQSAALNGAILKVSVSFADIPHE